MSELDVLFVEDDPILRFATEEAFRLEGLEVTSCADARSALSHIGVDFPGVVVSDIQLPGLDGVGLLREVMETDPEIPVILVTGHGTVAVVVAAMQLGARNVIEKPFHLPRLLGEIRRALAQRRATLDRPRTAAAPALSTLTPREREIVELVALGMTNAEIAGVTQITEGTVKRHLTHTFDKLGMSNRAQLVRALAEMKSRSAGV